MGQRSSLSESSKVKQTTTKLPETYTEELKALLRGGTGRSVSWAERLALET